MITAKPSIYNSISIYNGGGGGKDNSPDIPDNLKKFYTQLNSLATTSNGNISCNDLNTYKSSDFIIATVSPWKAIDYDTDFLTGTQNNYGAGNFLFRLRGSPNYYPGIASTWVKNSSSEKLIQYNVNIGDFYTMVLNNPYFFINGVNKASDVPMGTDYTGKCVRIFGLDNVNFWAFRSLKIQDKNSLVEKAKIIPVKEKSTSKLGVLDTLTEQFFEGNQAGFFEYIPE